MHHFYVHKKDMDGQAQRLPLLDRLRERFDAVSQAAAEVLAGCPSVCAFSCIDCL